MTWNGEEIVTGHYEFGLYYATLDGFDPTPWDADTPASGIHSIVATGASREIAACELLQELCDRTAILSRPFYTGE